MKIQRILRNKLVTHLRESTKGILLYGPRQSGKTTLVDDVIDIVGFKTLVVNGDQRGDWWEALTSREISKLTLLVSGYEMVVVYPFNSGLQLL